MTWLFPLYFLGAAAILGPILMHLRRRPPQDRVEFSSLMFLDAQTPMPVSKRRLEHWLLLLLRCLALLLLALMFARPLWRQDETAPMSGNQATVILLDRSASMQRGNLWQEAVAKATEVLNLATPTDRLALVTFDREVQSVWSLDEDAKSASTRASVLKQRLAPMKPSGSSTDLGQALVEVVANFSRTQGLAGLKKRIVLISDLQEGAKLDALRGLVWPENVAVEVMRVEVPNADNFTLSLAASAEEEKANSSKSEAMNHEQERSFYRVRLSNARDSTVSDFSLAWDGQSAQPLTGYLAPGSSRVLSLERQTQANSVSVTGDDWDFDNRVFMAPPQPKSVKLVFIGDEKTRDEAASPLFYLSRAFQSTAMLTPELLILPETATAIPEDTEMIFISGARWSPGLEANLRAFVESGGLVVAVVTPEMSASALESLTAVRGITIAPGESSEEYQMLADVQTSHPLLRPFMDERLRDFTKLRFWKHRRVGLSGEAAQALQVIAHFDKGDPAILTRSMGQGAFILLTSGWHPADGQLALSTKFVPLLYGWLEVAGFRNEQSASLLVGDVLPVENASSIMTPDGQTLKPKPGETLRAEMAGIYQIVKNGSEPELRAVNLSPEEGRVSVMELEKLRELGVRLEDNSTPAGIQAEDKERLALSEQEGRQRAWIWLLGLLLAILGFETWLGGRMRQGTPQAAFTST